MGINRYRLLIVFWCLSGWLCCALPGQASASEARKTPETLPVAFPSPAMQDSAPEGWALQRYRGEPAMAMKVLDGPPYLRMVSQGDRAFGIKKELAVNLRETPFLNWQWRVNRLPQGGDIRRADRDDQALQIYLIFGTPGSSTSFREPTLAYIWDSEAPRGLLVKSPHRWLGAVRYLVVQSGADLKGQWHREKRNVLIDSRRAFGDLTRKAPLDQIRGILLFTNTHHTKGEAEADIGEIFFSRE
ncbi:MAG: DUF3047 domain-containing protein [Deltaproteobacteria bacterium]|nr:DUF3047 domain-containing protein [Deltaproteobacteria bacterium]